MDESGPEAPPVRADGLQISEDRRLERRLWILERWSWWLFGLIILAALAGFTGSGGYFAHARLSLPAAEVTSPRFSRWHSSDEFILKFAQARERHTVFLTHAFFEHFKIEQLQPRPETTSLSANGSSFEFRVTGGPGHRVKIYVQPMKPGLAHYQIEIDGERAELTTLVLP